MEQKRLSSLVLGHNCSTSFFCDVPKCQRDKKCSRKLGEKNFFLCFELIQFYSSRAISLLPTIMKRDRFSGFGNLLAQSNARRCLAFPVRRLALA
jgi:hypothetical protein